MFDNGWGETMPHLPTVFPCPVCEHPLNRVVPSRLLVCDNPVCTQVDPLFLVVGDG